MSARHLGFSFLYGLVIVAKTLIFGIDVPGYASILVALSCSSAAYSCSASASSASISAASMREIKQRPIYIVRRSYGGTS